MNRSEFEKEQLYVSVVAGMNQRFHQIIARRWTWYNRAVQVTVAVLAVLALCLSIYAKGQGHSLPEWAEISTGALAALFAIALNVLPLGDWVQEHLDLFRRWCDLREDIDALLFELGEGPPTPELRNRLKELGAKVHRISSSEPGLGWRESRLLKKCEADEKRSRPDIDAGCIPVVLPLMTAVRDGIGTVFNRSVT